MKCRTRASVILAGIVLAGSTAGAAQVPAIADDPVDAHDASEVVIGSKEDMHQIADDGAFIAMAPETISAQGDAEWFIPDPLDESSVAGGPEQFTPQLAPGVIALCNAGFGDVVIEKFATKHDNTIALKCGDSKSGYIHIKNGKEIAWKKRMPGPGVWDDFMVWASRQALQAPAKAVPQAGSKRCYTTPLKLYKMVNGKPKYWATFNPSIAISTNNKRIITSVPTTKTMC